MIVGSANMSETSFSGRQAEAVTVLDDDPVASERFSHQYEDVRGVATSNVPRMQDPLPGDNVARHYPHVRFSMDRYRD